MTERGRVLRDTNVGPGLLTVHGKQYAFTLEDMWKSELPPRPGMIVDVTFNTEGAPQAVCTVPDGQVAKEQAEQALVDARRRGGAIASGVKSRFGIPFVVAELLLLVSFFILPNVTVGNAYARRGLTGWEVTGLNVASGTVSDHGFLSLLAVVCLFAPLAVPFWRSIWSRWLYVAPLTFSFLTLIVVYAEVQRLGRVATEGASRWLGAQAATQMSREIAGMFSVQVGAIMVLICAGYLATRAWKAGGFAHERVSQAIPVLLLSTLLLSSALDLAAQTAAQQKAMTNADVMALETAGIGSDLIIAKVQAAPARNFDTSVEGLKSLQAAHVPPEVIRAMIAPRSGAAQSTAPAPSTSADSSDPATPHAPGIYLYAKSAGGKALTELQRATPKQTKGSGAWLSGMTYGIAKYKVRGVFDNAHAPVKTSDPAAVFYLYSPDAQGSFGGGANKPGDFMLIKLTEKNDTREITQGSGSIWGNSMGTDGKAKRGFDVDQVAPGIYKLTPIQPLPPGEYAFQQSAGSFFDFRIVSAE